MFSVIVGNASPVTSTVTKLVMNRLSHAGVYSGAATITLSSEIAVPIRGRLLNGVRRLFDEIQ